MDRHLTTSAARQVTLAIISVTLIDVAWLLLTRATGKTYHLAPLLVGAAPGVLLRRRPSGRLLGLAIGTAAVAIGWAALVLSGIEPSATIVHAQPGGVAGEVAVLGLIGLAVGAGRGPSWLLVGLRDRVRGRVEAPKE
jgi:hypothetical protein